MMSFDEHMKSRLDRSAKLAAAAPALLEACRAAQQCIADAIEAYSHDGPRVVLDLAMKDLKNDAGKLIDKAIKQATL